MHITEIPVGKRTANVIRKAKLDSDDYHNDIKKAARVMACAGFGDARYGGHYSTGTTWWTLGAQSLSVKADGKIVDITSY